MEFNEALSHSHTWYLMGNYFKVFTPVTMWFAGFDNMGILQQQKQDIEFARANYQENHECCADICCHEIV